MNLPNPLIAAKCGRGDYIEMVRALPSNSNRMRTNILSSIAIQWAYKPNDSTPNAYRVYNANSDLYLAYADSPKEGTVVTLEDDGSLWELRADIRPGVKS